MTQFGLFNDESAGYTEDEAVEAGFYSLEEAEQALRDRYSEEDELSIHEVEEEVEEEEDN
jgi:alkylated DNA repair dioxygenase AlkB